MNLSGQGHGNIVSKCYVCRCSCDLGIANENENATRSDLRRLRTHVADFKKSEDGVKITIRKSKTDMEGHGETIIDR